MKIKLLNIATGLAILVLPLVGQAQTLTLGTVSNYVLFSTNGAMSNTGITHLTGNVGTNNGSSTGFGNVNGVMNNNNGATGQTATDLGILYGQLNSAVPAFFPSSTMGNGDTLTAGTYSISGNTTITNTLYLNGGGNSNALFVFQLSGALSTAAGSKVILINGAKACNVFWKVEGLVSMASGTSMKGNVIANNAAINMYSGVTLEGRALSTTGAVSVVNVLAYTPVGCGSPYLTGPAQATLGATSCYAIFSASGPVTNSGASTVTGDIGTNVGVTSGYNSLLVNGMIHPIPDGSTNASATDLGTLYGYLNTLAYDIELLYPAQFGNNLVLTPHVYRMNAAATLTDTLFLNAMGNANAVFVIQVNGALATGTYAKVRLINGAQAKNVFWKVEGAVSIDDYSDFYGTIVCNNGALDLGTGVSLSGRALATNGALSTASVNVVITAGSASGLTITATSSSLCPGNTATLSVSGGSVYMWSNSSTLTSIVVTPSVTGSYSVVETSSTSACASSAAKTIYIMASPTIAVNSGTSCAGSNFTLVPAGAASYTYSSGSAIVNPASTSSYSVTGSSSMGCISSNTAVSTVTVFARPVVTANSGAICVGKSFIIMPSGAATYTVSGGAYIVSPSSNASYSVAGTSSIGCISASPAISAVSVNALPVISVNSGSICSASVFTMNPSGASTYTFSNGSSTVSPLSNSTYSVGGTSAAGCIASAQAVSNVSVVALPVVSVNSGSICAAMVFTITPSGAASYTISGGSSTVNPSSSTSYSVYGESSAGCMSQMAAISNVTVAPLPAINVNSGAVCLGQVFTMVPSGAATYTFSNGSSTVMPASATAYSVIGTSALGCVSASAAVSNVAVNSLPVILVNSEAICAGSVFVMTPSGAATYTYSNGSHSVIPAVNSTYSVTGTSAQGCISLIPAVASVTVMALPVISVNSGSICYGQIFTMVPAGVSTYTFSNGSAAVSPMTSTSYSVMGHSADGCVSYNTAVSNVVVYALPVVSVNSGSVCEGQSFTLVATGAVSYTYANGSSNVVTPLKTTAYSVSGTDHRGCVSAAAASNVTVHALPALVISSSPSVICAGEMVVITASGAHSYSWNTGSLNDSINVAPVSDQQFTVVGVSEFGCVSELTYLQTVDPCTGIAQNVLQQMFNLYPNPNSGNFTLALSLTTQVTITNNIGQVVYVQQLEAGDHQIEGNGFVSGVYYVNAGGTTTKMIVSAK